MKSTALYPNFLRVVRRNPLLSKGKRFLIACSGGLDSTVLCHLASRLRERMNWSCVLGHVNYGQRGAASDLDEQLVKEAAKRYDMRCYSDAKFRKKKGNFQDDARHYRYRIFANWAKEEQLDAVWVAHHLDDQLETVLFRLMRGSGIQGLSGMRENQLLDNDGYRLQLVRPLLSFYKRDLRDYAEREKLEYREDESNQSSQYTRNRIRNELLPLFYELSPQFGARLEGLRSLFAELEHFLNAEIESHIHSDINVFASSSRGPKGRGDPEPGLLRYALQGFARNDGSANAALVFSIERRFFLETPTLLQAEVLYRLFGKYLPTQFVSRETIDKLRTLIVKSRKLVHYDLGQGFCFEKNADRIAVYRKSERAGRSYDT